MEEKVLIGKITTTFGLKGELKVASMTDFPDIRFAVGEKVFLRTKDGDMELTIARHRVHKGYDLVAFEGMEDINKVEMYKQHELYAFKNDDLLEDGEVWISDLIGCEVYNRGTLLGKVKDVYENYQDILVVEREPKNVLIPYVDAFVKNKDIENKRIDVELIEGFIDDEN